MSYDCIKLYDKWFLIYYHVFIKYIKVYGCNKYDVLSLNKEHNSLTITFIMTIFTTVNSEIIDYIYRVN